MKLRAPVPSVIALCILLAIALSVAAALAPAFGGLKSFIKGELEDWASGLLGGLGLELSYEAASPRLLGSVSVSGLELRENGRVLARIERASLRYSLRSVLRGKPILHLLRIEGLAIDTDYATLTATVDRLVRFLAPAGESGSSSLLSGIPSIELRRSSIRLAFEGGTQASAELGAADMIVGPGGLIGASVAGTLSGQDPLRRFMAGQAELPFSATLSFRPDSGETSVVAFLSADSDIGRIQPLTARFQADRAGLRLVIDPGAGLKSCEASWDVATKKLTLNASVSGWKPAALFVPKGRLGFLAPWLAAAYSGSLSLSSDLSASGSMASVDLAGRIPLKLPGGYPLASLSASGSLDRLRVRRAGLQNNTLEASYTGEVSVAGLSASGTLALRYTLRPDIDATADFDISGSGTSWFAYAPGLRVSDAVLKDCTVSLDIAGSTAHFYIEAALPSAAAPGNAGVSGSSASVSSASVSTASVSTASVSTAPASTASVSTAPASTASVSTASASSASLNSADAGASMPLEPGYPSALPRLALEGTATLGPSPYIESALRLGLVDFSAFPELLRSLLGPALAKALETLRVQGELSVYSDFSGLSYNSSGLLFVYDGPVRGFGTVGFSGGLGLLSVNSLEASIAGYDVTGTASIDYGAGPGLGFETALRVSGIPYTLTGMIMDGVTILTGDYGLRVVARDEHGIVGARVSVEDMPLPILGTVSFLSASASARFASLKDWNLVFDSLSLVQPPGATRTLPSVSASGAFDEHGGTFGTLSFSDRVSTLKGSADVTWGLEEGFRVSARAKMAGPEGEYYFIDGEYRGDGGLDAVVSLRKAPLERLGLPSIRGLIDADATIFGSVADPGASFEFTVNGGQRAEGMPFAAGSGTYRGSVVTLADTRLRLGAQSVSGLSLRYNVRSASAELSAEFVLSLGVNYVSGRIVATGESSVAVGSGAAGATVAEAPSVAAAGAASPFDDYAARGFFQDTRWTDGELGNIPIDLVMDHGTIKLTLGQGKEIRARLGAGGELGLYLDRSLPLSFSAEGRFADDYLSLDVSDASVDLPFLFKLIGLKIIRVESGTGRGNLRIRGKLNDPSVEGMVEFDNFYLSVPDFVPLPIGPLKDPLYFMGKTMETYQSAVACGEALATASLEATLHGGIPDDIRLSVQTAGEGLVPVTTRLLGLDINGLAKPDLVIEANPDRSRIRGSITMQSGDIVLTTGVIRRKIGPAASYDFAGTLDLSFGKNVKVYFPDKRLPVIYGQADPSSRLSVSFAAPQGEYSLKGETRLRGGSVFYIQRNFYLKQALIEFNESQDQFDPLVSAEAETRSSTKTGPVLITLRTTDSRLSKLKFTLESVPSMSETGIQQLLGQNLLGGTSDGKLDIGRAVVENIDLIPQLNVASILERNLQALLGLDLFVVRSLVFQRWLYDLSGLSGSTRSTSIADYLEDSAIIAGKYIGDNLFFQVMLSLVSNPLASTIPLSLDSDISLEWKAPHFTLNWSIRPDRLDSLFIEDQSFTFLWRIPLQ